MRPGGSDCPASWGSGARGPRLHGGCRCDHKRWCSALTHRVRHTRTGAGFGNLLSHQPCSLVLWQRVPGRTLGFSGQMSFPHLHPDGWGQWLRCGPPPWTQSRCPNPLHGAAQGRECWGRGCRSPGVSGISTWLWAWGPALPPSLTGAAAALHWKSRVGAGAHSCALSWPHRGARGRWTGHHSQQTGRGSLPRRGPSSQVGLPSRAQPGGLSHEVPPLYSKELTVR